MLWIWSKIKKELFLKSVVPEKQAKSLKTICKELRFCCICRLQAAVVKFYLTKTISQIFLNGLNKTSMSPPCLRPPSISPPCLTVTPKKSSKNPNIIYTAQKMKFSNKDFFSKCDQIGRKLWIWSHFPKKSFV